jgi:hypothetical protein
MQQIKFINFKWIWKMLNRYAVKKIIVVEFSTIPYRLRRMDYDGYWCKFSPLKDFILHL